MPKTQNEWVTPLFPWEGDAVVIQRTLKAAFTFCSFSLSKCTCKTMGLFKKTREGEGSGGRTRSVHGSVRGELVRATSPQQQRAPGWSVAASCISQDFCRLAPRLRDRGWWWRQGAQGTRVLWAWPNSCHHCCREGRWAGSLLLPPSPLFWHERWFWTCLCMMALPIQNVPWEQLLLVSAGKRQPATYCLQVERVLFAVWCH